MPGFTRSTVEWITIKKYRESKRCYCSTYQAYLFGRFCGARAKTMGIQNYWVSSDASFITGAYGPRWGCFNPKQAKVWQREGYAVTRP